VAIVDIRVLTGERFNLLETGTLGFVTTADALFPTSLLYDGRPSRPYRCSGAGITQFNVDGNAIANGSLDSWSAGAPTSWTEANIGPGADCVQTSVAGEFVAGSAAKLANDAAGSASMSQTFTVRSGQKRQLNIRMRGDGVTGTAAISLQNIQTGMYLTAAGAWQAAGAYLATRTTNTYLQTTINYTVEAYSVSQVFTPSLRITATNTGALPSNAYVDELYDYPAVDVVSVHGHNVDAVGDATFAPQFLSSTDNFVANQTTEATGFATQPAFYMLLAAPVYKRYWRLSLPAANSSAVEIGELVIGQTYSLLQAPTYGAELGFMRDDVATESGAGEQHVYARTKQARRTLGLKFRFDSETKYRAARDEIFRRSGGRVNPLVIIPDTTLPDVIFGRIDKSWKVTRSLAAYYDQNDLTVLESAFPIATN
jgi:hypothetical protein